MNLSDIILNEKCKYQKTKFCLIPFFKKLNKIKTYTILRNIVNKKKSTKMNAGLRIIINLS